MNFIKFLFVGTLVGVLYGFVNFNLIISGPLEHLTNWAIHGFLFSFFYLLLKKVVGKFIEKTRNLLGYIILGATSGLLSCSFNIITLIYVEIMERPNTNEIVNYASLDSLFYSIVRYSMAFIIIGGIVGYLLGLKESKRYHA